MDRRKLLELLVIGGGLLTAGIVALPAVATLLFPVLARRREEVWRPVGPVEAFPLDEVREAAVEVPRDDWARSLRAKGVYVWRPGAEEFVVFSRDCTDLACPVRWDPGSECYFCPCHGGIFARNGDRMAGPPPRPLYRYANRIRDGVLEIDLNSVPAAA
jgi:menaquinol-cytochrome c reductase iron-sulfur subunit